jgi:hypothetical protein
VILASAIALGCPGCHEPDYRNEVVSDAQGRVQVHRVAKDAADSAAPDSAAHAPVRTSGAAPAVSPGESIDRRIETLQSQVDRLNEEITKLKLQKAAGAQTP